MRRGRERWIGAGRYPTISRTHSGGGGGSGIDVARLERDMAKEGISEGLVQNQRWAREPHIRETPAFIVGDEVIPGGL